MSVTSSAPEAIPANRAGLRSGQVSELTVIMPLKPGGAQQLREVTRSTEAVHHGVAHVGTVHDLRWIVFDNDTRAIFATTYDGDWDAYIDDFAAKIPELMDRLFSVAEGYPGITSPTIKDFIAQHQVTATSWYCAHDDLRLPDIARNQRVAQAVDGLLDAINP